MDYDLKLAKERLDKSQVHREDQYLRYQFLYLSVSSLLAHLEQSSLLLGRTDALPLPAMEAHQHPYQAPWGRSQTGLPIPKTPQERPHLPKPKDWPNEGPWSTTEQPAETPQSEPPSVPMTGTAPKPWESSTATPDAQTAKVVGDLQRSLGVAISDFSNSHPSISLRTELTYKHGPILQATFSWHTDSGEIKAGDRGVALHDEEGEWANTCASIDGHFGKRCLELAGHEGLHQAIESGQRIAWATRG